MATYSAADQINRALRLLGVLAEGETPAASVSEDALMALNQMIDSWNTERLSVFCTIDQIVKQELVTPAAAEKLLPKDLKAAIEPLTSRISSGLTLARDKGLTQ